MEDIDQFVDDLIEDLKDSEMSDFQKECLRHRIDGLLWVLNDMETEIPGWEYD